MTIWNNFFRNIIFNSFESCETTRDRQSFLGEIGNSDNVNAQQSFYTDTALVNRLNAFSSIFMAENPNSENFVNKTVLAKFSFFKQFSSSLPKVIERNFFKFSTYRTNFSTCISKTSVTCFPLFLYINFFLARF